MVTARASGARVEDLSQRTQESQVFANPDGTWTSESASEPVRVQDGHGGWHDIDTTLVARDGGFAPAWTASDLMLSGGGDRTFAQLTAKGHHLGWQWTQDLPAPVVKGNTATYPGVAPGNGDLVVTATATGFSYDVVLHQAPTEPVVLTSPVVTDGAEIAQTAADGVAIATAAGKPIAAAPHPMMWDAQVDAQGEPVNVDPVATDVAATASGGRVSLSPDQGFLTDPSTQYPVTVDPSFTTYTTGDMWIENVDNTDAKAGTEYLKVGSDDGGAHKYRTYLDFKDSDATSRWNGTHVTSATLRFWNYSSGSCAAGAVRASMITSSWATSNLSWANQPTVDGSMYDDYSAAHGATNCAPDDADFNVTKIVDAWAHDPTTNHGIRVKAVDETSTNTYREYRSVNYTLHPAWRPKLLVTYNRYPGTASALTTTPVTSYAPVGGTSAFYTNDTTPTFSARASDADGGTLQLRFEVRASASATATLLGNCTTGYVAEGSNASCSLGTALADNQTVFVRAKAYDGKDWAGESLAAAGGWSGWSTVKIAAGKPAAPAISCPGYADGSWTNSPPAGDVTCTVTATGADTTAPAYIDTQLGTGAVTRTKISQSTDPTVARVSVSVPKAPGGYKITAWAESPTSVASAKASYSLGYGDFAITTPTPDADGTASLTTANTVSISAAGPPDTTTAPTATLKWRIASSGANATTGWNTDDSADLTVTQDPTTGNMSVVGTWDTSLLTRDTAQGQDLDVRVPVLLDVQICLAYPSGDACSWSASQVTVQRVPHAFGNGFPTTDAGPGQVALWTGEFSTDSTDVDVPGYTGNLSISRTYNSFDGPTGGAASVFGPGWTAQLDGPGAGEAGEQVVDSTLTDGTLALVDASGESLVYAASLPVTRRTSGDLAAGDYVPVTEDTTLSGVSVHVAGTGLDTLVTVTDPDGTKTTFTAAIAPDPNTAGVFSPKSVTEPGQQGATTYTADAAGRVTRILAPVPPGVTCPDSGALNPGCRALDLTYTADRLTEVDFDHPGTGTTDLTPVATFAYDGTGRLASTTDPRDNLTTSYGYDTQGRMTALTPPGQAAFHLSYAGAGSGKLQRITRDNPTGSGTASTLATVVYDVPTNGANGTPSLTESDVETWSQPQAPSYAAAVFGMDRQGVDPANITAADWPYATLWYTDARGYTLNTAQYGAGRWLFTDTEYDDRGNPVRELDTGDIAAIQDGQILPADAGTLTSYAAVKQTNADGTTTTTVPAGALPSDSYAPARQVVLSDGSTDWARPHTHTDYDQGAPNGGIDPDTGTGYGLPTTTTVTPSDVGTATDLTGADTLSVTRTGYEPVVAGDPSGWNLGLPTTNTTVMPTGANITTTTRYDADGRVIETRQPKSNGADAGTRQISYYSFGSDDAACQHTAWAGAVCKTSYAGPAAAGPLPVTQVTGYNSWLAPTTVTDTVGTTVERTSHTEYDDADRPTKTWTTASVVGSTPAPGTATTYDPATGLPTKQQATDSTGALTADSEISTGYDKWARQTAYTPAPGETTTTSYNTSGDVAQVVDPKGTTSYSYDGAGTGGLDAADKAEHRDLPTSMTISNLNGPALSFTGAYDASGALVTQTMPGGITQRVGTDAAGQVTDESYSGQVTTLNDDGTTTVDPNGVWVAWSRSYDAAGRVAQEWTPYGGAFDGTLSSGTASGYSRAYGYDRAGRLVHVEDHTIPAGAGTGAAVDGSSGALPAGTTCQTRDYSFDANGNRTSLTRTGANADGSCAATGGTTKSWSYDTADRLTGGYTYDALGRATTIPAVDTPAVQGGNTTAGNLQLGYYDTDAIRTITQAGSTTTYAIDATGRRTTSTTGPTGGTTTSTTMRHYTDDSDSPGWTQTTSGATTTTTRYAESLGGDLGITIDAATGKASVDVVNPHGDIVTTIAVPVNASAASSVDAWQATDEYGNPQVPTTTGTSSTSAPGLNYGWLGGKQRATDNTGLLLMGARLYNPCSGAFTSTDPVFGGNTTSYVYPQDPVNGFDLTGQFWGESLVKKVGHFIERHHRAIVHGAISIASGVGAGLLAGAVCGASAGVACLVAAGAVFGASLNMTGQASAAIVMHEHLSNRKYAKWLAQGAYNGATAGYAKWLPKPVKMWLPGKVKILVHHVRRLPRIRLPNERL